MVYMLCIKRYRFSSDEGAQDTEAGGGFSLRDRVSRLLRIHLPE